ncbi:MAG: hypothetical protein AMXMBFR33_70450 [Candidatus Xenobia bacterium]|jgi:hypothetical protein
MIIRESMPAARVTAGTPTPSVSVEQEIQDRMWALEDENDRLRRELDDLRQAQIKRPEQQSMGASVHFEVKDNKLNVRDLELAGMHFDELTARFDPSVDLLKSFTLESILASPDKLVTPDLDPLQKTPITVERLRMSIPSKVAQQAATVRGADMLEREGLHDLHLRFAPGGMVEAVGVLDKIVSLPFNIRGKLELTADKKVRFTPEKVRVLGLPVPRIAVSIANAMAGDSLDKLDIRTEGDSLLIDPKSFLPKNILVQLNRLTTQGDRLVLEGGPPPPSGPPKSMLME